MDAKKFAWLYLVKNGVVGRTPSYYGGYDYDRDLQNDQRFADCFGGHGVNHNIYKKIDSVMNSDIQIHGVDWDATKSPQSDYTSQFEGTFCDPGRKEIIKGVLVLKNGSKQKWIADAIEVTNVFDMMARVHEASADFTTYFGDK